MIFLTFSLQQQQMNYQDEENIDLDTLQLRNNNQFKSLLFENESIILSSYIWKYNQENKCQNRIIVLTNKALLNVMKSQNFIKSIFKKIINPFDLRRRIPLSNLYGITMSPNRQSNSFIIHVINQHDYLYKAKNNKMQLLKMIAEVYNKQIKKNLPFYFKQQENMLDNLTLKIHCKEKKNVKPKQKPVYLNEAYFSERKFDITSYHCDYSNFQPAPSIQAFQKNEKIEINDLDSYYVMREEFNTSIKIPTIHSSRYILKPSFSFLDQKQQLLFTPYMPGGTLKHFLKDKFPLQKQAFEFYIACLILILEELHQDNIVYTNLSLDNIYVKTNGYLVLNGLEKEIKKNKNEVKMYKVTGNPHYTAPEVIYCQGYDKAIDIWKLGICAFYLHTGHFPFYGSNLKNLYMDIIKRQIEDEEIPQFIPFLLQKNVNQRIKIDELKELTSFSLIDWQKLKKQQLKAPYRITKPSNCFKATQIYKLNK